VISFNRRGYSPTHPYYVYILVDNVNGEIFYVGCSNNLSRRKSGHKKRFGNNFSIHAIGESSYEETALNMESDWIRRFWAIGCPLANVRDTYDNHKLVRDIDRELRGYTEYVEETRK
jgi:hypothetical protein